MTLTATGPAATAQQRRVASIDLARLFGQVALPFVAAGAIARRRRVMGLLERVQADAAAVRQIPALRECYGAGPLPLRVFGRDLALVLSDDDIDTILRTDADTFTAANREKIAALSPFQPNGVLISRGDLRARRRGVNEQALDTGQAMHHLAGPIAELIRDEAEEMLRAARTTGGLDAAEFTRWWWRVARGVVLGQSARDDHELTDQLWTLRSTGNWSFAHPLRHALRDKFTQRLQRHVESAPAECLAGALREVSASAPIDPVGQIPHWLFAFDAAGMVTLRTMALLATHPRQRTKALDRIDSSTLAAPRPYDYLRGCVLDSTRLWPTTPAILRDSLAPTEWEDNHGRYAIPAGAAFVILTPAFHRDRHTFPFADRFEPEIWIDGRAEPYRGLVPFSAGPTACPGRNLVLLVASTVLANLFSRADFTVTSRTIPDPDHPLPATLNNFGITLSVR
ncbi:cytochrome P450 [Rhodococcus sp. NPDC056960]|uniref:cytochrome P450 n=1 Tax=Rhodococcus sp. NPDC056960 TaxID=3345982 RepID=UPI003639AA90